MSWALPCACPLALWEVGGRIFFVTTEPSWVCTRSGDTCHHCRAWAMLSAIRNIAELVAVPEHSGGSATPCIVQPA